jgi:branched-chain amino acid transport system ATP-binding protein
MFFSLQELTVHYGVVEIVRAVSFEVLEGTIVGLLGANGSGKSTIFKTISGIKKPTSGEIYFQGGRIDGTSASKILKRGIALVPEGRRLFPYMTVLENLEMGAYSRRDLKEIRSDLERIFGHFPVLKERKNQIARTLSGGEQEMVAIARALMTKPKLLLLDEPVQGLAPSMVEEVENIIDGLNKNGMTIILIEHNVHMALGLCHKVCILDIGKIILEGTPSELSETDYVRKIFLV